MSKIDWSAAIKEARTQRAKQRAGRAAVIAIRERAKTDPYAAIIADPGKGTQQRNASTFSLQMRRSLEP